MCSKLLIFLRYVFNICNDVIINIDKQTKKSLSDSNGIRTRNNLVRKQTLRQTLEPVLLSG